MDITKLDKGITLSELIQLLDVPYFGKAGADRVADKLKNIRTLRHYIEQGGVGAILLSIDGIGVKTKDALIEKLEDIELFLALEEMEANNFDLFEDETIYKLESFEDIQAKLQTQKKREEQELIEQLLTKPSEGQGVKGLNFVITGALSRLRADIAEMITDNGGAVQNMVNTKTNYLVLGDDGKGTVKYRKATAIGTKIISEADLMLMI